MLRCIFGPFNELYESDTLIWTFADAIDVSPDIAQEIMDNLVRYIDNVDVFIDDIGI